MTATVLGGGFGLYGYLPALLDLGYQVCLPWRYQSILVEREDGRTWCDKVRWVEDEAAALAEAESIVIAKPPQYQAECVRLVLAQGIRLKKLYLEKPMAPSPREALDLLAVLRRRKIHFKIAYLFLYEPWMSLLEEAIQHQGNLVSIHWSFMAHHFRNDLNNWKREHYEGGGVLRFYAIHLLAVAAFFGYSDVQGAMLEGDARHFLARFSGKERADLLLDVDSGSEITRFSIAADPIHPIVSATDPFLIPKQSTGIVDYRVGILRKYLKSPFVENSSFYERVLDLWSKTEEKIGEI